MTDENKIKEIKKYIKLYFMGEYDSQQFIEAVARLLIE